MERVDWPANHTNLNVAMSRTRTSPDPPTDLQSGPFVCGIFLLCEQAAIRRSKLQMLKNGKPGVEWLPRTIAYLVPETCLVYQQAGWRQAQLLFQEARVPP